MGIVAIDTGGTFTDLVYSGSEGNLRLKVPSNAQAPERAIVEALGQLRRAHPNVTIDQLRHGSTVATNALLERKGARCLFVTNAGFEDLLRLRRQDRPELYALHPTIPPPLAFDSLGIVGRIAPDGSVTTPLEDLDAWTALHQSAFEAAESVALCLLHSFANTAHESQVAAHLRRKFPHLRVSVSSEIIPLFREYERASTVSVNAYVAPVMVRYLKELSSALAPTPIAIMGSAGGLLTLDHAAREPVHTVLSGPAGGVRGALAAAQRCGRDHLLALDMGGTSADVSVVSGEPLPDDMSQIDIHPLRIPILPIETVGAGGGSIAYIDDGGALRVGPRSAGAHPGPACYRRGGTEPTVTDAHVVLGRIESLLGGTMALDRQAALDAIEPLAAALDQRAEDTAQAVIAIAEATMVRACKRVTMERGVDPRGLTLVAFGGAGGLHACGLADALGARDVLFPRDPGVLSAHGIAIAPFQSSASRTVLEPIERVGRSWLEEVANEARSSLPHPEAGTVRVVIDARYEGQTHALPIELDDFDFDLRPHQLRDRFIALHQRRYGYDFSNRRAIEATAIRAFASETALSPENPRADYPAKTVRGPTRIASYGATLWVEDGWQAEQLPSGDWRVEQRHENTATLDPKSPLTLEIHRQRLSAIAEEMGTALMRSAFSANIKERRDFSCAVFDADGQMLAQAAHIPVHLGSQPLSVRAAIAATPNASDQSIVLNAPFAGGTHLPDVTLVTPVCLHDSKTPDFYVANRAHHADVGGISAGSMPCARQRDGSIRPLSIDDEGFSMEPQPLTESLRRAFAEASRTPDERYGDIRAQEAANHVGVERLKELAAELGASDLRVVNATLLDYGERRMRSIISAIPDGRYAFSDALDDDGFGTVPIQISLELQIDGEFARFDFSASDDQTPGSLNAVRAIAESAVFYCLRCLGDDSLPTNDGLMRTVEIITQPGSIVDAQPPAAVSGGNVETSQRIVDVVFGALAKALPGIIPAASGGTMNNVLFGGMNTQTSKTFVHYETLACGAGASSVGSGADAIQCHMTNTLNTPIEEFERAFPLRIESYSVRPARETTGGFPGGSGVCRRYHALSTTDVTLITERRLIPPYALGGAQTGDLGKNTVVRANGERETLRGKESLTLNPGDTLVIETPGGGGWQP